MLLDLDLRLDNISFKTYARQEKEMIRIIIEITMHYLVGSFL